LWSGGAAVIGVDAVGGAPHGCFTCDHVFSRTEIPPVGGVIEVDDRVFAGVCG
jgi:hypothetical protein